VRSKMAKKSRKQYFNELAREFAYSGPVLCQINFTQYAHIAGYHKDALDVSLSQYVRLDTGESVIVYRGPLPNGQHRTGDNGSSWLLYSFKYGPVYIKRITLDFDYMFKKI